ncbi:hypothetical protein XENOCAPTIV_008040 [Xenoophorus captivus]|uniref:Transcriptional adaptor 2A n=1 Tax=Xenoophorus captivus TaxID=1517983 RepID=A0ABV0SEY1_9TELE
MCRMWTCTFPTLPPVLWPFFLSLQLYESFQCFTRGFEYKKHESDHKYEIMTSDFPVLEPGWTAQEEMALLEAVMDCGFGNWQDVAYQMRTKTKEECESHYMKNFINNPLFSSTLLSLRKTKDSRFADGAIPFKSSDDPPRPTFESVLSRDMAGYMPARADFMEEFDNYAEWDLKDIDFVDDDSDILHTLKLAVVDIYHSRLKERQRRKKIIRDHGLINLRKFQTSAMKGFYPIIVPRNFLRYDVSTSCSVELFVAWELEYFSSHVLLMFPFSPPVSPAPLSLQPFKTKANSVSSCTLVAMETVKVCACVCVHAFVTCNNGSGIHSPGGWRYHVSVMLEAERPGDQLVVCCLQSEFGRWYKSTQWSHLL